MDSGESRIAYLQLRTRRILKDPGSSTRFRYRSSDKPQISGFEVGEAFTMANNTKSRSDGRESARWTGRMNPVVEEEVEKFFANAERAERKRFADRYNFDVEKEVPLEGRFEWVKMLRKEKQGGNVEM